MRRSIKWSDGQEGREFLKRVGNNDAELKRVNLSQKKIINDADIEQIAPVLESNTVIHSLDLSGNNICGNGGITLSRVFRKNSTISYLHICSNLIGDEGAREFGYVLRFNSCLKHMDISVNKIGDSGAQALASGLKMNSTLEYISLSGNEIGDQGARDLASALEQTTTLKHLDLSLNRVTTSGVKALESALQTNTCLVQLNISQNDANITMDQKKNLKELLIRNQNPPPQPAPKHTRRITLFSPGLGSSSQKQEPEPQPKEISHKKLVRESSSREKQLAKGNPRPKSQQLWNGILHSFGIRDASHTEDEDDDAHSPKAVLQQRTAQSVPIEQRKPLAGQSDSLTVPTSTNSSTSSTSSNPPTSPTSSAPPTPPTPPTQPTQNAVSAQPEPPARKPIVIKGFELIREIGAGGYGKVYEVRQANQQLPNNQPQCQQQTQQQRQGTASAMKMIPCSDDDRLNAALNEVVSGAHIHPNIVEIKQCLIAQAPSRIGRSAEEHYSQRYACIVMELCEGGDLRAYILRLIKKNRKCKEKTAWKWLQQACSAFKLMHSKQRMHRDIKPENILLTGGKSANIKLSDFGIARMFEDDKELVKTQIGTMRYVAPEMTVNDGYTMAVDMWGIGIVFFELLTRQIFITPTDVKQGPIDKALLKPEHSDETAYFLRFRQSTYLDSVRKLIVDLKYSHDLAEVVCNLMDPDPNKRRSAHEILKLIEQRTESVHCPVSSDSPPLITIPTVSSVPGAMIANFEIPFSDLQLTEKLGQGGFGQVCKAIWNGRGGGMTVAVKMLLGQQQSETAAWFNSSISLSPTSPQIQLSPESRQVFETELGVMLSLGFPNVVRVFGACIDPNSPLCIVQEFAERGSLFDVLHQKSLELEWPLRWRMAKQATLGLNYLHNCKPVIIHRDIKSPNFLVDKQWTIKICDFGLAKIRSESTITVVPDKAGQLGMPAGSVRWSAPETMVEQQSQTFSTKSDVYSLGMTMWEIVSREIPFRDQRNDAMIPRLVQDLGVRPTIPEDCPAPFKELIQLCFRPNPAERPSCAQILKLMDEREKTDRQISPHSK